MVKPYSTNTLSKLLLELSLCTMDDRKYRWSKRTIGIVNQVIAIRGAEFTADVIGCTRARIKRMINDGILTDVPAEPELQEQMKIPSRRE